MGDYEYECWKWIAGRRLEEGWWWGARWRRLFGFLVGRDVCFEKRGARAHPVNLGWGGGQKLMKRGALSVGKAKGREGKGRERGEVGWESFVYERKRDLPHCGSPRRRTILLIDLAIIYVFENKYYFISSSAFVSSSTPENPPHLNKFWCIVTW